MLPHAIINVERAAEDLRRGMPVALRLDASTGLILIATEELSVQGIDYINNLPHSSPRIILARGRSNYLFEHDDITAIPLEQLGDNTETIVKNAHILCGAETPDEAENSPYTPRTASKSELIAFELAKIAELIPSLVITDCKLASVPNIDELITVDEKDILSYKQDIANNLTKAAQAPLKLKGAENARIVSYRPAMGGVEHYAIIIGTPEKDEAPLVRVHSSCYTGDLLGSLTCDCGDQLRSAIALMGEKAAANKKNDAGGIILYLMQEGRGIGLTNKLRTYALQAEGHDTVDANKILGFDEDERLFEPAAAILSDLGIKKIRLLTNNPRKAQGLEELGISVPECVPHIMETHEHNDSYLKTKAERLGHKLN